MQVADKANNAANSIYFPPHEYYVRRTSANVMQITNVSERRSMDSGRVWARFAVSMNWLVVFALFLESSDAGHIWN